MLNLLTQNIFVVIKETFAVDGNKNINIYIYIYIYIKIYLFIHTKLL
jgi:hypothetical protein